MSTQKKKTTRSPRKRFDGCLIHQLMVNTGLSREGILKNLRNETRPVNFLVAKEWDRTLAEASHV